VTEQRMMSLEFTSSGADASDAGADADADDEKKKASTMVWQTRVGNQLP